jgi:uncharacterized membrane protein
MHNAGQAVIAALFTSAAAVSVYFPVLALISVPCGIITGVAADRLLKITRNITIKNKKTIKRRKA